MKHLLLAACLLAAAPALGQTKSKPTASTVRYELRGVITYLFNENQGNKPDIGAKAFVVKASLLSKNTNIAALETYLINHDLIEHTSASEDSKLQKMPDEMSPADKIEALKEDALIAENDIIRNANTTELTADGGGVFIKKLAPGNYVVLIRSANRMRINPLEANGQMAVRRVAIKDDDKEVAVNFTP